MKMRGYGRALTLVFFGLQGICLQLGAGEFHEDADTGIQLLDGFDAELLYDVPESQGSWVAMCQDDKGRLIVSDQYGGLYRFPFPKLGELVDPASIEAITYSADKAPLRKGEKRADAKPVDPKLLKLPNIGNAQGLCYAFDSLYVVVNSKASATGSINTSVLPPKPPPISDGVTRICDASVPSK